MKALIFNSGKGSRLGELTKDRPKSMMELSNGETLFGRQLRILSECGIKEFVVTTGPFADQLEAVAHPLIEKGCHFAFVPNPLYAETNYIYSMHLAERFLRDDDFLLVHGDLVFDAAYVQAVLDSNLPSLGSVNRVLPLPEKDFKARVKDCLIVEVGVEIFGEDCCAFQPLYKLSQESMGVWLDSVRRFVEIGNTLVYAENAANAVFEAMHVAAFSYEGHVVEEIDTPEDLQRVSEAVRLADFKLQPIFELDAEGFLSLASGLSPALSSGVLDVPCLLRKLGVKRPFLITGSYFESSQMKKCLAASDAEITLFSDYDSNPRYDQVVEAVHLYRVKGCDAVLSVGGGSAIDVAKCVKMFAVMPGDGVNSRFVHRPYRFSPIPHIAVPATAGTGSESTSFAVLYVDGEKVSIAHDCLLPDAAILDVSLLAGLPAYRKKSTLLDALCQAIESYWSVRSTKQSRVYSSRAIRSIVTCVADYLAGDTDAACKMLEAANQAGKAINLTTTTAPHAMSYKLTSLYGIPHGHAVALCMPLCWGLLLDSDASGLTETLREIATLMTGCEDSNGVDGLEAFERLVKFLDLDAPSVDVSEEDLLLLVQGVNIQRLSNFPYTVTAFELTELYRSILHLLDRRSCRS